MIIGVIRESQPGETRVSATPSTAAQLIKLGYDVVVEPGAGAGSTFADQAYVAAGASIGDAVKADVVFGVNAPSAEQLDAMRDGVTLVSILGPDLHPGLAGDLSRRRLTALARRCQQRPPRGSARPWPPRPGTGSPGPPPARSPGALPIRAARYRASSITSTPRSATMATRRR